MANAKPLIVTVTPQILSAILRTIRTVESGGDYNIPNKTGSSASGAYQFLDKTWANYGGYARAMQAPPAVQDERALKDVLVFLKRHGNDVRWVAAAWYAGDAGARSKGWDTVLPGNRSSINQYVNKWMAIFQREMAKAMVKK